MMDNMAVLDIPSLHPFGKGYRVVFEKQECSPEMQHLSQSDQKIFSALYDKVQEDAKQHIEALKQLYDRCPGVPEIANLLTFAYLRLRKTKQAEGLIEQTWKNSPDNLIARINYADLALRQGKKELIPQIFKGCLDLNKLYPQQDAFHFAEFRGFMTVLGFYHLRNKEREKAEECYQLAFQVDPLHPSVAALEKKLSNSFGIKKCLRVLQRLARISKNP